MKAKPPRFTGFRTKLLVAMMLVVSVITALVLSFAQRNLAADVEDDLERQFAAELAALHNVQEIRHAALVERCRALVRKPRIHAALEDNALDLLYPSAKDELRDVMERDESPSDPLAHALRAKFYRFLDRHGQVISPPNRQEVGVLTANEEAQLTLPVAPDKPQLGYLARPANGSASSVAEVIAMPIISGETNEVIAALVLGFAPNEIGARGKSSGIKSGIWLAGELRLAGLNQAAQQALSRKVGTALAVHDRAEHSLAVQIGGEPHLLFYQRLNDASLFPPAYEVCIYPLEGLVTRQRELRWRILGLGGLLLLGALGVSHVLSARLSKPVEKLAIDSEEQWLQRVRAEAALESTHEELQRSARFSADASHQLKTPVTVLRAGLEELLGRDTLAPEIREELSTLVHQTFRLSSVIEDLLLLSKMDAGRLKIDFVPLNLTDLIDASLDDLDAAPDALELKIETDFPAALLMAGEKRYTAIVLQNLLENARKYNRPGGTIRVTARQEGDRVRLRIGNTGRPIPAAAQAHIFERFHRGAMGEDVPGYGLGLNLARELARLHGGELRLARSDETWTEFEVQFRAGEKAADLRA